MLFQLKEKMGRTQPEAAGGDAKEGPADRASTSFGSRASKGSKGGPYKRSRPVEVVVVEEAESAEPPPKKAISSVSLKTY